ncbi:IS110 family transposase [Thiohalocapsa marina]|uniref:IS110 family transposase n=1 Tax=Thiohalocapsa marina TaxID=424902 RepID=A0A5M8FKH4_9GAMM|nr:transposase [Thiohalocapsa marina]KAA6184246.1 IS110 family transposase [Thiohalocapsa marina]
MQLRHNLRIHNADNYALFASHAHIGLGRLVASQPAAFAREDPLMQLLLTIPGIGPINGTALLAGICDASQFRRGRDLAAWLGLVPRQYSTGGKTRLLGISKHGNRHLRVMLIHGARAVLRVADKRPAEDGLRRWVERITVRKHANVAVMALANKLARILCAVLQR